VLVVVDKLRCQFECEADFLCSVDLIANKMLPLNLRNERSELMQQSLEKSLVVLQCEGKGRVDMRHQLEDPWSTFAEAGNFAD